MLFRKSFVIFRRQRRRQRNNNNIFYILHRFVPHYRVACNVITRTYTRGGVTDAGERRNGARREPSANGSIYGHRVWGLLIFSKPRGPPSGEKE